MVFYDVDYTLGDRVGADALYFHAWFNRENPTTPLADYTVLPEVTGRGRFIGANIGILVNRKEFFSAWWGEGEMKVYLDGDTRHPTLAGTGTEDYAGSAWGIGPFSGLYSGCTVLNDASVCFYRWHIPDPIYFHSSARVQLQQIGLWDPTSVPLFRAAGTKLYHVDPNRVIDLGDPGLPKYGLIERRDDVSSCAYFYLDRPASPLPGLKPLSERTAGLADQPH